ncbi:MAG: hypothetical protein OER95_11285 [Acidimicrobiia bacterium]|nr:hypothetical protein [Acidimicrobiia bacterium]
MVASSGNLSGWLTEADDFLEGGQQVSVARHEYSDTVLAAYGHHDEVEGDLDVDALLLRFGG